jgi:hypothetical protein
MGDKKKGCQVPNMKMAINVTNIWNHVQIGGNNSEMDENGFGKKDTKRMLAHVRPKARRRVPAMKTTKFYENAYKHHQHK